uniref:NADH-ubiquinone oxidoreductase chain 4L n=1 Tax=Blastobotrys adeninivorans TaxID=409370 RepID=A0A060RF30_BLAAD
MLVSNILIIIGLLGFIYNRKSIMLLLINIEVMLLGVTLNILIYSNYFNDSIGLIWTIAILILAGAESAIGLSLLVNYYRLRGNINIDNN